MSTMVRLRHDCAGKNLTSIGGMKLFHKFAQKSGVEEAEQVSPALQDDESRQELQDYLAKEHLLMPALNEQNKYDEAAVAKVRKEQKDRKDHLDATVELINIFELGAVSPDRIKAEFKKVFNELNAEA